MSYVKTARHREEQETNDNIHPIIFYYLWSQLLPTPSRTAHETTVEYLPESA